MTRPSFYELINTDADGCWVWQGPVAVYGPIWRKTRYEVKGAHRWAYEHKYGPLGTDCLVRTCPNKLCVNPDHMRVLSLADNGVRAQAARKRKAKCRQGHDFAAENTYVTPDGKRCCRICRRASQAEYEKRQRAKRAAA